MLSGMLNAGINNADSVARSLREGVVHNPDSVLRVLDGMTDKKEDLLPAFRINLLRSLAWNEKRMFPLVERYALMALDSDSIEAYPQDKLNALTLLLSARSASFNFTGSLEYAEKSVNLARKLENQAAEYNILTTVAKTAFATGNRKEGYKYIDRIIKAGESSEEARVLANVSAAYGVKVVELCEDCKFEEGLKEGHKRLALIDRIDKVGGAPEGFTDQQRAYAYARIASCAYRLGNVKEASDAYDKFISTSYAKTAVGRVYILDYLLDSRQWNRVLEFTAPLYPMFEGGDTISEDFRSLLISDSRAYAGLGDYRKAYSLSQRLEVITDSLYNRADKFRAQEYSTMFHLNEKELELANAQAELDRRRIITYSVLVACVLLVVIVVLVVYAWRQSEKNRRLAARQIDELLAMYKMESSATDKDKEDFDTFQEMQKKIVENELFRNPDFNRDCIMRETGVPRGKISRLIQRFAEMSVNDYINKLRVEYSLKLIKEHPEWTVDAIAEGCGYVRRATFYTHFNRVFGITPTQYRKEESRNSRLEDEMEDEMAASDEEQEENEELTNKDDEITEETIEESEVS